MLKKFDEILAEAGYDVYVLQTDRGSEFLALKQAFKDQGIHLVFKSGQNKANYAEAGIRVLKNRISSYLQDTKARDWPVKLPEITLAINRSPSVSLGYLAPAEVQSPLDEPRVRLAQARLAAKMTQKQSERYFPKPDSYHDMIQEAKQYDQTVQPFRSGDFCYKDVIKKAFTKGTDQKRGEIFIINEVIKNRSVKRYKLLNINFKPIVGSYYKQNLRKVPLAACPTSPGFFRCANRDVLPPLWVLTLFCFRVEYIVRFEERDGIDSALVKWCNLDESHNKWIPKANLTLMPENTG